MSKSVDESHEELIRRGFEQAVFDSSEIIYSSNGRPDVIVVKKGTRSMAIRILPPDTVCKFGNTTRYKDLATLELDLSGCENFLQESQKSEIFSYIEKSRTINRWIYNPLVEKAYLNIMKRSKAYYDAAQARRKQAEEERRSRHEMYLSVIMPTVPQIIIPSTSSKESEPVARIDDEIKTRKGYDEIKDRFTQQNEQIRDSFGIRWIQCEKCGQIKPDSCFSCYGGENRINLGLCKECSGSGKR